VFYVPIVVQKEKNMQVCYASKKACLPAGRFFDNNWEKHSSIKNYIWLIFGIWDFIFGVCAASYYKNPA